MADYDPGPPTALAAHFAALPSYAGQRDLFWYDWGPVFYRRRLDRSARVRAVASDPGPTERIACRTLVGDAGQRVQGFLSKLGLTHSYVLLNAFPYALHPSRARDALPLLTDETHKNWRNRLFDLVSGPALQAIVAFGGKRPGGLRQWDNAPNVPTVAIPHPSSRNTRDLLDRWRAAVTELRAVVTPDAGHDNVAPNYGTRFTEADYTRIPASDLPFGLPDWFGDDRWGPQARPRHNNSVERPPDDPDHTLLWQAPEQGS